MKFLSIIYDKFEELEATAPYALLLRANQDLVIASDKTTVTSMHGITFKDITILDDVNYQDFDCLIIPGGAHYAKVKQTPKAIEIIKYFMDNNKYVACICAAPTILGELGYLNNKNYTCYTSMNKDFGGNYIPTKVVVDGKLITARSVDAAMEFGYEIVNTVCGKEVLNNLYQAVYHEE